MAIEKKETCLSELAGNGTGNTAVLGFSVGLGNLWRFHYVRQKNGCGAFLIPYFISTTVLAIPLILEVALGQFSGKRPIKVWAICPLMKGVWFCILCISCIIVPYYSMVFAWALYYMYSFFSAVLPWTTCGNSWNTPRCIAVVYGTALMSYVLLLVLLLRSCTMLGAVDGILFYLTPDFCRLEHPQVWLEALVQVFFFTAWGTLIVMFGYVETALGCMDDILPRRFHTRHIQPIMAAVFMTAVFTAGLVFTTHLVDWYIGAVACFGIAILECVAVGWLYGAGRFSADVETMVGKRLPVVFKFMCFIVLPILTLVALIFTLASYKPPTYGEYNYPASAVVFGWFIAFVSVVPIPVTMVIQILKMEGSPTQMYNLYQRVKAAMPSTTAWLR